MEVTREVIATMAKLFSAKGGIILDSVSLDGVKYSLETWWVDSVDTSLAKFRFQSVYDNFTCPVRITHGKSLDGESVNIVLTVIADPDLWE